MSNNTAYNDKFIDFKEFCALRDSLPPKSANDIINRYVDLVKENIEKANDALDKKEYEQFGDFCHKIKSNIAYLGGRVLENKCIQIETSCINKDFKAVEEAANDFRTCCKSTLETLDASFLKHDLLRIYEIIAKLLNSNAANQDKNNHIPRSVLVVEDDQSNQFFMKFFLKDFFPDLDLKIADDGAEALSILEQSDVDMIFLDLMMPGMNGYEFLERWSQDPKSSEIRLVVLTTSCLDKDKDKVLEYDCVERYITKPLMAEDFKDILNTSAHS